MIRWAVIDGRFGPMLAAATARGICRLSFGEGEAELRAWFPNAALKPARPFPVHSNLYPELVM